MKEKITFIYLIFGIVSILLVGSILYYSLTNVLVEESIMSTKTTVNQTGKYLETYVDKLKIISNTLVNNQDVIEYFSDEQGNKKSLDSKTYEQRIHKRIENIMKSDTSLESIIIISKDGKVFSNEENLDMSMSKDMMEEKWYIKAIHNDMPTLTSARMQPFSMDKNLWVISLSQEIVNVQGENIGVAVIDVPYTAIETYLMDLHLGNGGYAYILNNNQDVVFHQDKRYYEDGNLQAHLVRIMNMPTGYQKDSEILINQYKMSNTDWTLVAVSSVDALTVLKRQVLETVIMGISIILIVVLVTSVILKRLLQEIQSREQEIHHYEMNVMYGQINPHFLYNTLDTIVWMAEFNQKEDVIKITKTLAHFFRLSLNQGKSTTSLSNEIEHVRQYLYIQKQRYQDKLAFNININEDNLEVIVPKIILQPIVENAIYHGIKDKDGEGTITINVTEKNEDLFIEVKDDGIGFDMASLDENNAIPQSTKTKLGGVGLTNVDRRIKLFCGETYGLQIHSEKGLGTSIVLKLCKNTKAKEELMG